MMRKTPDFYATFYTTGHKQNRPRFSTQTALKIYENRTNLQTFHKSTNLEHTSLHLYTERYCSNLNL